MVFELYHQDISKITGCTSQVANNAFHKMFGWCSSQWAHPSHKETTMKGTILIWMWLLFL